jgi:WD40 repeat protein
MSPHHRWLLAVALFLARLPALQGQSPVLEDKPAPKADKSIRTDLYGDPLPPGALARLGTVRLRHPSRLDCIAFSPKEKVIASGGPAPTVCFWDLNTGREVRRFAGPGEINTVVFSPDGSLIAGAGHQQIIVWNSDTRKELVRLKSDSVERKCLAFSRDGKVLISAAEGGLACLWEIPTGKKLREVKFQPADRGCFALARDGSRLAVVGKEYVIHLWDVATGKERYQVETKDPHGVPVFSPDGKMLAFGDEDAIVLWDLITEQARLKLSGCRQARAWTFSPDGASLAVGVGWGSPQPISLWDTTSGKRRPRFKTDPIRVESLTFSLDGKLLAAGQWSSGAIHLWDAVTGKQLHQRPGHGGSIFNLTFLAAGKKLLSAGWNGKVRVWDVKTAKQLQSLDGDRPPNMLAVAPDEDQLALASGLPEVELCRLSDDKRHDKLMWKRGQVWELAYSSDGICFICSPQGFISGYDTSSGKPVWELQTVPLLQQAPPLINSMVLSPDGKTLLLGGHGENGGIVFLIDRQTKKVRYQQKVHRIIVNEVAVSPDGRLFAVRGPFAPLTLWESASGKLRLELAKGDNIWSFAFAPDGNALALGTAKGRIDVWEVTTGKLRCRFSVPHGLVGRLAFSPDGRTLASSHADHTILIWDLAGQGKAEPLPVVALNAKELAGLWNDLAGDDGLKAHQAIGKMVAGGKTSVEFLQKHLSPVAAAGAAEVKRLLADLEADQFKVRQQATRTLARLHDQAKHSLEEVLKGKPTLELRRRVEMLLKRLDGPLAEPEVCRGLRALEVLEQIGTAEARQLLGALAKGLPEARVTQEAQASLQRLGKRALAGP